MKTDTYFVKQNIRTRAWVRLDRVTGRTLTLVLALTGTTSVPAGAFDTNSPQTVTPQTQLVSVNRTGTNGSGGLNGGTGEYTISTNGRFVVFTSSASDLVPNDTNGGAGRPIQDVFLRDLQNETTTLVSVNRRGTDSGNDNSGSPAISADGRFVAFASSATDLVVTDITGGRPNVFVRDMQTGITTLASVNRNGTDGGNGGSEQPSLSADGRFVAFISTARDLLTNDIYVRQDVFVRDLQIGTTTLASVNRAGTGGGNDGSATPLLSANGRFVAFQSLASDLVTTDSNGTADIFVRDLQSGTTMLVSVNHAGADSGKGSTANLVGSSNFAFSPNGRFVAFSSQSSDLVATDTNGIDDVFIRDLQRGITTLVSVNRAGTNSGNGISSIPSLSVDGRFVAFQSLASDLVATDTNGIDDVFIRDLQSGTTTLVSVNRTGTNSGNRGAFLLGSRSMNADGRFVAFSSQSTDLVATDTNGGQSTLESQIDVFVRDLQTRTTTLASVNRAEIDSGNNGSEFPVISTDGRLVVFPSAASLVANDTNEENDLYVAKITSTSIINDLVTFEPLAATYRTSADPTGCPPGFVGTFGFDAQLTTQPNSPPLSDLAVKVTALSNGNLLHNADGGNGGVGSMLTMPKTNGYADGTLSPGESVVVHFNICLKVKKPFTFVVDVLGMQ